MRTAFGVAYGLKILYSLPPGDDLGSPQPSDVTITARRLAHLGPPPQGPEPVVTVRRDEVRLVWRDVGVFAIRKGREIVVDAWPAADPALLRLLALGPALGVLLHQRGLLVLHASAVSRPDGAALFLGDSGAGKSTLAAALHAAGHAVVSDDVTAVDLADERAAVLPGFPCLKLWPDAAAANGTDPATLPRIHPSLDKRTLTVAGRVATAPVPVRRVYVLAEGVEHAIETIPGAQGVIELVRYSYGIRVLHDLGPASRFRQCAALAAMVALRRLTMKRSLAALPELVALLDDDHARG